MPGGMRLRVEVLRRASGGRLFSTIFGPKFVRNLSSTMTFAELFATYVPTTDAVSDNISKIEIGDHSKRIPSQLTEVETMETIDV